MTGGMAMFQSELRSAVREARERPASQAARPASIPVANVTSPAPASVVSNKAPPPVAATDAGDKRTVVRLWLPLTPLWIVLAPFALLLAPVLAFVPAARGMPPFRTALTLGAVLLALSGTVVAVDSRGAVVRIRIF